MVETGGSRGWLLNWVGVVTVAGQLSVAMMAVEILAGDDGGYKTLGFKINA
ncbi:hypothetical protein F3Y22_tig00111650pilonHSYRG00143 [Hibiscus syriacus]|uniref:Uncharacterized protein n=1 Tax=Hibiscus syriacus TaxID=106335 RepID=A0A6A2YFS9_HIBSY|nr:hypothetical protein F3Y22_tig00111650pilonHSYRG00143 [Hibiscus syriacus]